MALRGFGRPKRNPTTIRFKQMARFEGEEYVVYGKEGTKIRTIFPDPRKHPGFAAAPFGARFKVWWRGRWYGAVKSARWQENGARVPCLDWEVEG
ncbi:MAG: hypothetical protein QW540_09090 [Archaeoglobaceae archaeon]